MNNSNSRTKKRRGLYDRGEGIDKQQHEEDVVSVRRTARTKSANDDDDDTNNEFPPCSSSSTANRRFQPDENEQDLNLLLPPKIKRRHISNNSISQNILSASSPPPSIDDSSDVMNSSKKYCSKSLLDSINNENSNNNSISAELMEVVEKQNKQAKAASSKKKGQDTPQSSTRRCVYSGPDSRLPEGWTKKSMERIGDCKGRRDHYWISPCGKQFRSWPEVTRFLESLRRITGQHEADNNLETEISDYASKQHKISPSRMTPSRATFLTPSRKSKKTLLRSRGKPKTPGSAKRRSTKISNKNVSNNGGELSKLQELIGHDWRQTFVGIGKNRIGTGALTQILGDDQEIKQQHVIQIIDGLRPKTIIPSENSFLHQATMVSDDFETEDMNFEDDHLPSSIKQHLYNVYNSMIKQDLDLKEFDFPKQSVETTIKRMHELENSLCDLEVEQGKILADIDMDKVASDVDEFLGIKEYDDCNTACKRTQTADHSFPANKRPSSESTFSI